MNYQAYEFAHAFLSPMRLTAEAMKYGADSPFNPFAATPFNRAISAACEVFENVTRRYGKPKFGIDDARVGGLVVPVKAVL
jgi:poly(3-hydroxybutyrate) depolymerase